MKKKSNGLIKILILIIIIAGVIFAIKYTKNRTVETGKENTVELATEVVKEKPKELKIVDKNSKSRPYAVMINNHKKARPQCGLQDAYIVYEIIVEGGITRMMAVYKDQDTEKIGSIRSARHYFIDYAQENDAIYVHWGGSPQAYDRISRDRINDLDQMSVGSAAFFRDRSLGRATEHTGFTDMNKLKQVADKKGYTRDTNKDLLLNYSIDEIDMASLEGAKKADNIKLKYSDYQTTSYEYDEENKVYKRSMSGKPNTDLETKEQYTAKNIIIYKVGNYTISGSAGRQELENIGSGDGWFVSGGYSIPITWEKKSHSSQTIYKYTNGEKLVVNDGNTFIQICPLKATISITSNEPVETNTSTNATQE